MWKESATNAIEFVPYPTEISAKKNVVVKTIIVIKLAFSLQHASTILI